MHLQGTTHCSKKIAKKFASKKIAKKSRKVNRDK